MKASDCYCPMCGRKGLTLARCVSGVSVVFCPACQVEMTILLEPEIEGDKLTAVATVLH